MPLQSSGQISLSQIATEFGGSAPHSLSEYYGDGNAPASGEIQLAADFYGTSNAIASGTITPGYRNFKGLNDVSGYEEGQIGSISSNAISGTSITIVKIVEGATAQGGLRLQFSGTFQGWTSITINGTTLTRGSENAGGGTNPVYDFNSFTATPTSFTLV